MPAALIPKEEVLNRLALAFRTGGYQGTSLKELSSATGLPRASLYNYFPGGKEDMAQAVLDHTAGWLTAHVIQPLQREGDPRARLQAMTKELGRFYENGRRSCLIALFGVGEAHAHFGRSLKEAATVWQDAIATAVHDAGVSRAQSQERAEAALIAIQGSLVMARAKDDPKIFVRTLRGLPDQLLA